MLFGSCQVHHSSAKAVSKIKCNSQEKTAVRKYQTGSQGQAAHPQLLPSHLSGSISASPPHQSEVYDRGAPPLSTPQQAMRAPALRGDSGGAATAPAASAPLMHVHGL